MYERFTDRARKTMQLANQEAQRLCHEYIGTEHLLLGLLKEGSGIASMVLMNLKADRDKIRQEIERLCARGPDMITMGKLPQTPRCKKVIQLAMDEARTLEHSHLGTEHLLLGLLKEQEGIASQVLASEGVKYETTRGAILDLIGSGKTDDGKESERVAATVTAFLVANSSETLRHAAALAAVRLDQRGTPLDKAIAAELRAAMSEQHLWTAEIKP